MKIICKQGGWLHMYEVDPTSDFIAIDITDGDHGCAGGQEVFDCHGEVKYTTVQLDAQPEWHQRDLEEFRPLGR